MDHIWWAAQRPKMSPRLLLLKKKANILWQELKKDPVVEIPFSVNILILLNHWWTKWEWVAASSALPHSFVSPGLLYFPDPGCQAHMINISLRPQRLERGQVEVVDKVSDCLRQSVIWPDCACKHLGGSVLYTGCTVLFQSKWTLEGGLFWHLWGLKTLICGTI